MKKTTLAIAMVLTMAAGAMAIDPPGYVDPDYTTMIHGGHVYGKPRLVKNGSVTVWAETRSWHSAHTNIRPYWRWYLVWPNGNEAMIKDWSQDYWVAISFDPNLFQKFMSWGLDLFSALAQEPGLYRVRGEMSTEYRPPGGHEGLAGQEFTTTFVLFGG